MSHTFRFVPPPPPPPPSATDRLLGRPPALAPIKVGIDKAAKTYSSSYDQSKIDQLRTLQDKLRNEWEIHKKLLDSEERNLLLQPTVENWNFEYDRTVATIYGQIRTTFKRLPGLQKALQIINEMEQIQKTYPEKDKNECVLSSQGDDDDDFQSYATVTPSSKQRSSKKPPLSTKPRASRNVFPEPQLLEPDPSRPTNIVQPESSDQQQPPRLEPTAQPKSSSEQQPAPKEGWSLPWFGAKPAVEPAVQPVQPAPPAAKSPNGVVTLAKALNRVLQRALTPLLDAIGAFAIAIGEQDVRSLLVYDERNKGKRRDLPADRLRIIDEEDPQLTTVAYLMERYEPILGNAFLNVYLEQTLNGLQEKARALYKKVKTTLPTTSMKDCVDFDRDLLFDSLRPDRETLADLKSLTGPLPKEVEDCIVELETAQAAADLIGLTDVESRFAPAWAFSMLGNSVFRAVASPPVLAAFEMAANQVRSFPGCSTFTLKELLCSPATMNHFVFLATRHYMRDISVLAATKEKKGHRARGGNYINVNQARKQLDERNYLTSIWFEGVYAVPNPMLAEFDAYRDKLRRTETLSSGERVFMPLPDAQEQRMTQYRAALPQRELRHSE